MIRLFSALRASQLDSSSLAAWLGKWQAEAARTRIAQARASSHSLLGLEMWSPHTSLSFGGSPRWKVALGQGMNRGKATDNVKSPLQKSEISEMFTQECRWIKDWCGHSSQISLLSCPQRLPGPDLQPLHQRCVNNHGQQLQTGGTSLSQYIKL